LTQIEHNPKTVRQLPKPDRLWFDRPMPPKKKTRTMSAEHKEAIKAGRAQNRAVSDYLSALEATKGRPGRRRTPQSIDARLAKIDELLASSDAVGRLNLMQEQEDLRAERETLSQKVDLTAVEAAFVKQAAAYSERKGIRYAVWRKAGVTPAVLAKAGIKRGS